MNRGINLLSKILFFILALFVSIPGYGQSAGSCPDNIGFESGNFNNWQCYTGSVNADGTLSLSQTAPFMNVHEMFNTQGPIQYDPLGNFPVNCPNGSGYSIKLGNEQVGAEAERVSYTFTIPAGQNNYSIIYNYAVVIENPNHAPYQQPKFRTEVFDVTTDQYIQCASFEFVASPNLPGFQQSPNRPNVYYREWSPVTINLSGYAGKTIRLEFTNNDCSQGGHFGYAYLDIDENCSSPIRGNSYCGSIETLTLKAPLGFQGYNWFNANFTQVYSTSNVATFNPALPPNTVVALELIPHPGLGCLDTVYTTIQELNDPMVLKIPDSILGCISPGIDLTKPEWKTGSTPGLKFGYFHDSLAYKPVLQPAVINTSNIYYIQGTNSVGCSRILPVKVALKTKPLIQIPSVLSACAPNTFNLTDPAITSGSDPGLNYSYWKDPQGTVPLAMPHAIDQTGTYYLRGQTSIGCANIVPANVRISLLKANAGSACGQLDLTAPYISAGSTSGFQLSYWTNAAATNPVAEPKSVTSTGTYYLKGDDGTGCISVQPIPVLIKPIPQLPSLSPAAVNYPATVNLSSMISLPPGTTAEYFHDMGLTKRVSRPDAISRSGTIYIFCRNEEGCTVTRPVNITVIPPPAASLDAPNAFSPNGDGINEVFQATVKGFIDRVTFTVFNRWGQPVHRSFGQNISWDGRSSGNPLPTGTYYWTFEAVDAYRRTPVKQAGSITLIR